MVFHEVTMSGSIPKGEAWARAAPEKNWLLFSVFEPDKKGKRAKFPIRKSNPVWPVSIHTAASMDFKEAEEHHAYYKKDPQRLARVNEERKHRGLGDGLKVTQDLAIPNPSREVRTVCCVDRLSPPLIACG
jgi:hypothetical protein